MNANELRRRAIAAVAKLSIFAGAAGCTGTVIVEADTDTDTETDARIEPGTPPDEGEDPIERIDADQPDIPVKTPGPACAGAGVTTSCCNTVLVEAFADPEFYSDPANPTQQHKDCCELVLDIADTWTGPEELPFNPDLTWSCCTITETSWEESPSCMAWGPPMPPAMIRKLLRARRAPIARASVRAAEVVS